MSTSRFRHLALTALAAITLAACGDDSSGPAVPALGNARITLSAEGEDTTMVVDAAFGKDWDEAGENRVFGIAIGEAGEDASVALVMARRDTTQPGIGELEVADMTGGAAEPSDDELQVALVVSDDETLGILVGRSGTVRITRSTAQSLAGTIDIVVEGLVWLEGSTEPVEVEMDVTGTFNATPGDGASTGALKASISDLRARGLRLAR